METLCARRFDRKAPRGKVIPLEAIREEGASKSGRGGGEVTGK